MSSTSIVYRGYTLTRYTDHGPWFVYENLVEVMEHTHPSCDSFPVILDLYFKIDLAKRFVCRHELRSEATP